MLYNDKVGYNGMISSIVKNNYNIAKSQDNFYSHTLRNFKAIENSDDESKNSALQNKLTEDDIAVLSSYAPDKKLSKVASKTLKTLMVTIPVLDVIVMGATKSGNLSSKISKSLHTAGKWGTVFAAGAAVSASKSLINSKVEKLDNFDKKHPVASTFLDFFAIYSTYDFLLRNGKKISMFAKDKFPKLVNSFDKFLKTPVANALNKSLVNKKIIVPAEKFVAKRPYLASTIKLSTAVMVPAMLIASFLRFDKELKNRNSQVERNKMFLNALNNEAQD